MNSDHPEPVNLSLDPALVSSVDRYAKKMNLTRSGAFAEGAKLLMTMKPAAIGRDAKSGQYEVIGPRGGERAGRIVKKSELVAVSLPTRDRKVRFRGAKNTKKGA